MRIDAAEPETGATYVGADDIARWEHPAIALAISWAGLIAATLLLFRMGVEIGLLHGVGWIAGYFAILGWLECHERREVVVRSAAFRSVRRGVPLFLFAILAILASGHLFDFSVDGISTHQDPVVAMMQGWNPVKDPFFSEAASLVGKDGVNPELVYGKVQKGCALSFGSISAAVIGSCTGNHESGKAINLMVIPMVFGFAYGCGRRHGVSPVASGLWALGVSANPVILYQTVSFLQDALVSAFYGSLLLYAMSWFKGSLPRASLWVFTCLGFVLAGLKLPGMGYAGISLGFLGLGAWVLKRKGFGMLLIWGGITIVLLLWAGQSSRFWQITSRIGGTLSTTVEEFASERVVEGGGGFGQMEGLSSRSKFMQFVLSHGSRTHPSPTKADLKIPFSVTKDELMTFYHLSGEPRAGGFGPLGSGIILLSLLAAVSGLRGWSRAGGGTLFVGLMALVPLCLVPVFWARWIGHLWVGFMLVGLPYLKGISAKYGVSSRGLPLLRLFPFRALGAFCGWGLIVSACVNGLLVWVPCVSGHLVAGRILNAQLEVVRHLEQPVTSFVGWSGACRFWMIREGVAFDRDYLTGLPFTRLFRAETRVFLTNESLDRPFDSSRTIRQRLNEIQAMSKRLQPGQFYAEIIDFPDEA